MAGGDTKQTIRVGAVAIVVACGAGVAAQSTTPGQSTTPSTTSDQNRQTVTVTGCLQSGGAQGATAGTSGSTSSTAGGAASGGYMLTSARMRSAPGAAAASGGSSSSSTNATPGPHRLPGLHPAPARRDRESVLELVGRPYDLEKVTRVVKAARSRMTVSPRRWSPSGPP